MAEFPESLEDLTTVVAEVEGKERSAAILSPR